MKIESPILLLAIALNLALAPNLLAAPGQLDAGFGINGTVTTSVTGNAEQIKAVAVQPDSKIVVVGESPYGSGKSIQVVRYLSNGALDTSFDFDGIVTTPYADSAWANAVALQTDGKILVAGYFVTGYKYGGLILRYNPDGSLDQSFGNRGIAPTLYAVHYALAVQPDGKIIAAGGTNKGIGMMRYNADGRIDTSFGNQGVSRAIPFQTFAYAKAVTLQPDGAILMAGNGDDTFGNTLMLVTRHTSAGAVDTSFGKNGGTLVKARKLSYYDQANGIALQVDGKIVILGSATSISAFDCDMALARLENNGTLDTTFGSNGIVVLEDNAGVDYCAYAGAIQPDGKILAVGVNRGKMAALRLNTDGTMDNTFGVGGELSIDSATNTYGVALQPDGKMLLGGTTGLDYALVRLLANDANNDNLAEPWDLTPDEFTFNAVTGVLSGSLQTSSPITVAGLGTDVSAPLRITDGEYSKNGGAFSSLAGSVKNGDVISVRHTAALTSGSSVLTTLSIGGMYAPNNDALLISATAPQSGTFASTTSIAPSQSNQ